MAGDLLVVGLDLATGQEVHVDERSYAEWRKAGYNAAQTLVCCACYHGLDAPRGTRIPLVTRGRLGGRVRMHWAHPPHQAPVGGHHPETMWHLTGKLALALWARRQSNVAAVRVEQWTPEHNRRADVMVELRDRQRIALEVQRENRRIADRDAELGRVIEFKTLVEPPPTANVGPAQALPQRKHLRDLI